MVTRSEVKVGGQGQGIGHGVKSREGSRLGSGRGSRSRKGSMFGVKVVVKVGGQGQGSRSWGQGQVMIGGHKVGGQGRWSRSGYRSWGQVEGRVKVGVKVGRVKVWGSRSESRLWSRSGSRSGVKVMGSWSGS